MRPIQLKMRAFGPYKDTETIDFTKLYKRQLFVISGATGAGKTTIFDAICFALYGTASGSDREHNRMLRSQFADDATYTAVDFTFSLKERTYRVFRQLPHVRRGNKTKTGAKCELYEIDANGTEIPAVDRQIVTEVNEKIESLIGLTKDQFQQIMMLPQGEFMKLLTSDTENKEKILRRIFQTEKFERLNELIGEHVRRLRQQFETERKLIEHEMQTARTFLKEAGESLTDTLLDEENIHVTQFISEFKKYEEAIETQVEKTNETYKRLRKKYRKREQAYQEAKTIHERFLELDEKLKQLKEKEREKDVFAKKEMILQAAERALHVQPYEAQYNERKQEFKQLENCLKDLQIKERDVQKRYKEAKDRYEEEKGKEDERQQLHVQIARYEQLIPYVKELDETKAQIAACNTQKETLNNTLKMTRQTYEILKEEVEELDENVKKKERELFERSRKQSQLLTLENKLTIAKRYDDVKSTVNHLEGTLNEVKEQYLEAKRNWDECEQAWYADQAAVLATTLKENESCPVCGSTHHPQVAKNVKKNVTETEVKERKKFYEEMYAKYEKVRANYDVHRKQLKTVEEQLHTYEIVPERVEAFLAEQKKEVNKLHKAIQSLEEKEQSLQSMQNVLKDKKGTLKEQEATIKEQEKKLQQVRLQLSQLDGNYRAHMEHVPENVRNLDELKKTIATLKRQYNTLQRAFEESEKTLRQTKDESTSIRTEKEQLDIQLKTANERKERAKETFLAEVKVAQFNDVEEYKRMKYSKEEIAQMRTEVESYKEQLAKLKTHVTSLQTQLKDKKRPDLYLLKEEVDELEKKYENAFTMLNEAKEREKTYRSIINKLQQQKTIVKQIESEVATYVHVYDVVRGQNEKRISLERYVQMDYLDQIIEAANVRFHSLTNGQFTLVRSDRQEMRGRQSGLAFDVFDSYTNQARDVKTLSGGEKFIASLCLALGMSDVIQQYQGGVTIETIWIDEGFGHLDDESLQKAIEVLISLQKAGRMIGVISHVETLKSLLPARIEVTKTKAGYSKTELVIT